MEQGMVSKKAFDDALAAKDVGAAQVKAAQAALAEAKLNLSYTRVEAPIAGVASRALVSEGSLVEAQRTLLTDVSQIDPIRVIFSMAEAERLNLATEASGGRVRMPKANRFVVTLRLPDGSTSEQPGVVDFSDLRVNPQTGTTEVRATLPNPGQRLRPGQFVRVQLQGAQYMRRSGGAATRRARRARRARCCSSSTRKGWRSPVRCRSATGRARMGHHQRLEARRPRDRGRGDEDPARRAGDHRASASRRRRQLRRPPRAKQ